MKLEKIQLKNFKSFDNSVIEPKKITVLIGPTNSGKSSILQALLMLKVTCQRKEDHFVTKHTSYDYGRFEDIVTLGKMNDITIGIEGKIELESYVKRKNLFDTKFQYSIRFNEEGKNQIKLRVEVGRYGADFTYPQETKHDLYAWDRERGMNLEIKSPSLNGFNPRFNVVIEDGEAQSIFNDLFLNGAYTEKLLDRFYYIPFSRAVTSYSSPIDYSREILSTSLEQMSSALLSRISADPKLKRKISRYISLIGNKSIEPRNVETYGEGGRELTLDFVRGEFSNSIINEGSGLNQLIMLFAILVDAPKKSFIAIEEPELHLDPISQSKLVNILLEQIETEEKQILFTTHSEHMLYPILAKISKKGGLTKDDVAIYYFNLDKEGKFTGIENLEINEHGQIKGGLKGLWEVDANAMLDILGEPDD